jgi:hypothetical protein
MGRDLFGVTEGWLCAEGGVGGAGAGIAFTGFGEFAGFDIGNDVSGRSGVTVRFTIVALR